MVTIKVEMANGSFGNNRNIKNDFAHKFIELNKDKFINLAKEKNTRRMKRKYKELKKVFP